jgi:hypothetical protein
MMLLTNPSRPLNSTKPIAFYYGDGKLSELAEYQRVVLIPEFYTAEQLAWLKNKRVMTLGYLSMTEDTGPEAPWQRKERNPDWGGAFVHVSHPDWANHVLGQAQTALAKGFDGLFLDTLDIEWFFPEELPHLLMLIATLRETTRPAYLMANRGFRLLPRMTSLVDGHLFESFSVRWTPQGTYQAWPKETLHDHAQIAENLLQTDLELFALDYCDTPELEAFARERARRYGMHSFISNRELGRL